MAYNITLTFYLTLFLEFYLTFFLAFYLASFQEFILAFYCIIICIYLVCYFVWHALWHKFGYCRNQASFTANEPCFNAVAQASTSKERAETEVHELVRMAKWPQLGGDLIT